MAAISRGRLPPEHAKLIRNKPLETFASNQALDEVWRVGLSDGGFNEANSPKFWDRVHSGEPLGRTRTSYQTHTYHV